MAAVRRPVSAPGRPNAVTDRQPTVLVAAAAADAADPAWAVHRRPIVEVHSEWDHRNRNAHVSQVHKVILLSTSITSCFTPGLKLNLVLIYKHGTVGLLVELPAFHRYHSCRALFDILELVGFHRAMLCIARTMLWQDVHSFVTVCLSHGMAILRRGPLTRALNAAGMKNDDFRSISRCRKW